MGDSDSEEEEEEEEEEREEGESDESPSDVAQAPEVPEATEAKPKAKPVVDLNDPERVALVTLIQAFAEDDHERTELKLSPSLSPRERAMAHEVTTTPHVISRRAMNTHNHTQTRSLMHATGHTRIARSPAHLPPMSTPRSPTSST